LSVCFQLIQKPIHQFSSNKIFQKEKTSGCVLYLFHHGVTAGSRAGTIKPHGVSHKYLPKHKKLQNLIFAAPCRVIWQDMLFCVNLFVCLFPFNSKTNRSIFFKQHFSEREDFWLCFVLVSSQCDSWESRSNDKTAPSISQVSHKYLAKHKKSQNLIFAARRRDIWRYMSFCVNLFVCLFPVNSKTDRSIFFNQDFSEREDFWLCFVFVSSRCNSWETRSNNKTATSISQISCKAQEFAKFQFCST
jgi:hypothetical protein